MWFDILFNQKKVKTFIFKLFYVGVYCVVRLQSQLMVESVQKDRFFK